MKNNKQICGILLLLSIAISTNAQTIKDKILSGTQRDELRQIALKFDLKYRQDSVIKFEAARVNGWPTENLYGIDDDGTPIYEAPSNNQASNGTGVSAARIDLNTTGSGMTVGMWEPTYSDASSMPRITHQDFSDGNSGSRITIGDSQGNSNPSLHATHVAGTLIGLPPDNVSINSRGMAYSANLISYGTNNDVSEMSTEAQNGMLISNHSYGFICGWQQTGTDQWTWHGGNSSYQSGGDDSKFGAYNSRAKNIDEASYLAPYYLSVWAAGNDNNNNPTISPADYVRNGPNGTYELYNIANHPPGDEFQSCNICTATGLNMLTIGNVTKDFEIRPSSSRGLLDDGRLGIDICGIGSDIYSASSTDDDEYYTTSGTSMAAPNVAGGLLILQDGYDKLHGNAGNYMKGATLKALVAHTASDMGIIGPDDIYGWGLFNAGDCTDIIRADAWVETSSDHIIIEDVLSTPGEVKTYQIHGEFARPLTATMAYYDPVNPSNSVALQNDLDLRIIKPSGAVVLPLATNGNGSTADNDVDNVEHVYISFIAGNIYQVEVSLEGTTLYNDAPQPFSLIISGIEPACHHDIVHDETDYPQDGTYTALASITSSTLIDEGDNITYKTEGKVILKPGFKAPKYSTFKAMNGSCD